MMSPTFSSMSKPNLTLLFGPHEPNLSESATNNLRAALLESPNLQWILDTVSKLPEHWQSLEETLPELRGSPGKKHLQTLIEWLRRGKFPEELFPLPNILVGPLVVITHMIQYVAFLKQVRPDLGPDDNVQEALSLHTEAIGISTGLLSAAAVAISKTLAQLETHGAVAMRVAMATGALLDAGLSDLTSLIHFFDSDTGFQSTNSEDQKLHQEALQAIRQSQANWHQVTFFESPITLGQGLVIAFGRDIPQWLIQQLGSRLMRGADAGHTELPVRFDQSINPTGADAIAIVGMSCVLPGSDDVNEFWETLIAGKSQHIEVPSQRLDFDTTAWRDHNPKRKWFGNFVRDHDAFDHKFFRKSPREMASTDPQQRMILQCAYQAVEQSGYFNMAKPDPQVGCYVGIGVIDYENNVASHPSNAYTATGTLKSFAAGKVSHFFGWSGPGVTVDTACSSSAVAVHYACQAILNGECSAALAGGTSVLISPEWYQNLDGASFLSPTGQCKPFDVNADGYCRGEGAGAIFIKKLSTAIQDGNQVFGLIRASSINQNENCSAITAPSTLSLSNVFRSVVRKAGMETNEISLVEAHGTGTQVGDRAEYDSIRKVFGGANRERPLLLGSVKGLIGHLEAASGIAALIKTLLMMHNGTIPPQPSFNGISPKLNASESDNIIISTEARAWDSHNRVALLNNYGASGSNASLIIAQAPPSGPKDAVKGLTVSKCPFWLCGFDERSLKSYSTKLTQMLRSSQKTDNRLTLKNLSFQVFRQSNRSLGQAFIFSCNSLDDLEEKLTAFTNGDTSSVIGQEPPRPVILCFGGQVSTFVGLDRDLYDQVKLLRSHLDRCDEACRSLGLDSIYPGIFQRTPVDNIVHLQTMLFAIQYSCAQSWINSGVQVAASVGHSFGELTSMCVSGMIDMKDTIKMIADRARIIQEKWGPEKGHMMAIDGDQDDVQKALREAGNANPEEVAPTIACFNGPRSFTLAGTVKAMELLKERLSNDPSFSSIKMKPLDVTNAFHSTLVDSLMEDLATVGEDLIFREPVISHEKSTQNPAPLLPKPGFIASHLRNPVYFDDAIQRLAKRYPSSIWLEAGSNSGIAAMISRALGSPRSSHFQSIDLKSPGAIGHLTDATIKLWKEGLNTTFWAHHVGQISDYPPLLLPPYQFEKSKHWMARKKQEKRDDSPVLQLPEAPKGLWTFLGYQDTAKTYARFQINTKSEKYLPYISAHFIAQTAAICPSALAYIITTDALKSLNEKSSQLIPELQELDNNIPLCIDASKSVWINAEMIGGKNYPAWNWNITSSSGGESTNATVHMSGRTVFRDSQVATHDFEKFERLVDRKYSLALLDGNEADFQSVQGPRNIYKMFASIVNYDHAEYKGVQKIVGKGNESAGRIIKQDENGNSVGLADMFCQIAGIFLNCMTDCEDGEMFVSNRVDQWIKNPKRPQNLKTFEVYARHCRSSNKSHVSDIFVFDSISGELVEVILGLRFVRVSLSSMSRHLEKLSPGSSKTGQVHLTTSPQVPTEKDVQPTFYQQTSQSANPSKPTKLKKPRKYLGPQVDIAAGADKVLCNLLGMDTGEIKPGTDLLELGIDSLLAMEVAREVGNEFKIKLEPGELVEMTDVQSLVRCIQKKLGISDELREGVEDDDDDDDDDNDEKTDVEIQTPTNSIATSQNEISGHEQLNGVHTSSPTSIPATVILETFTETKQLSDHFLSENNLAGYTDHVLPKQNELVVVLIVDAFEKMGCYIRGAKPGQVLDRISHLPKHERFASVLYDLLEKARFVDLSDSRIIRTATPVPLKSAEMLLQELLQESPEYSYDHKLTNLAGVGLADCLAGRSEGAQLIFGTPEGRELIAGSYALSPFNVAWISQIENFCKQFLFRLPKQNEPINILELGAGTGGTTARILPLLVKSGIPFQYTVSDISASLVAGLRKRFKHTPGMRFEVIDIEKTPAAELMHHQHVVFATNCLHATRDLTTTTKNIHNLLRPDGFLIMMEMSRPIPWVDLVFGLFEGWWLFNDGREHAVSPPESWRNILQANGYSQIDWSDGNLPENSIQHVIIALASGPNYDRVESPPKPLPNHATDSSSRQVVIDAFVQKYTQHFCAPVYVPISDEPVHSDRSILITGATGSLGSHLVAYFASQPNVRNVMCLNRISSIDASVRQLQALESRGLFLDAEALSKLKVFQSDTSKAMMGLSSSLYKSLANSITDVVHNAWAMSMTRPVRAFELQIRTMQNMVEFGRECASWRRAKDQQIGFQFISSIAVVGYHPFVSGEALVPEEKMTADSALPIGYADAKLICEHMLDQTLHRYPDAFRTMVVRVGQIAGSKTTGQWNPVEHLAHLIKSSQTLKTLPDLDGILAWCPVDDVAATLGELLLGEKTAYPIYHLEHPIRQSWREMILILAEALDVPKANIVPYEVWVRRVREFPPSLTESENPAARLVEFFDSYFRHMSCGNLILDMAHSKEHSKTLRNLKAVSKELVYSYVQAWKDIGFLR